ncbi:uncharacterized protein LOC122667559 isoform X2 [Telopea speciosissima]|uniref:uncharacterized protein LOC122667559 isoform X2 n=1 Tax=Telopea speciosissima TaxID=54955 RepID=UPI001CC4C068|nr:uncharacterized protein LOC122667559 isoform X2 [Telopea speciosissima]
MEETEGLKTKKRKQSSSASSTDPFAGIFTRRRSEIFLHRNRSGHVRPYSTPARKHNTKVQLPDWCRGNPRASNSEVFDNEIVRNSIKDLRARRVFSPASISDECYSNGNIDIVEDADFQKPQLAGVLCKSKVVENEESEVGMSFNFQCTENHQLTETEGTRELSVESCRGEKKSIGESEILGGEDDFTEDWVQTTPPDTDVFCKSRVEDNGESTVEFDLHSRDNIAENPSSRRVSDNGNCVGEDFSQIDMDKNDRSRNRSRMEGLVPCSRLKLFKTPNSFSYRRLLPFLMDIAKDNSTALEIRQCKKVEKSFEEKPVPPFSVSLSQEIPMVVNADPLPTEHPLGCLASPPPGKRRETAPLGDSSGIQGSNLVSLGQPVIERPLQYLPESNQGTIAADVDLKMLQFPVTGVTDQLAEVCLGQPENNLNCEVSGGSVCSNDDWFQTIAPNTDVICKLEAEENGGSRMDFDPQCPQCAKKHQLPEMEDKRELLVESCQGGMKINGDGEVFGRGVDSTEEWVQATPPDVNVFCKLEVEGNGGNTTEFDLQSRDNFVDKNDFSHTKSRMDGLIPCSRSKLFKAPNSFSYRRLLPFLTDIAKDNSSALKIRQCEKVEKSVEEKPVPPFLFSSSQEIPMEGVNTDPLPVGHHLGCLASTPPEIAREAPLDDSSEIQCPNLRFPGRPSTEPPLQNLPERIFISTANDSMIITAPNSSSECSSEVQNVMPNSSNELDTCNAMGLIQKADGPAKLSISLQAATIEQGALHISSYSSTGIEEDCTAMKFHADVKPLESLSFCQDSPQFEALVPSVKPAGGPTKGILKRNPRGCRGPCTCLNCSSFRLHAERAFEFSRNQLQDAEEVATLLMVELNCLKNLLGEYADASKEHAVFEVSQVKEACTNASRVEELAKTRLLQMNHDLSIHCRMTIKDSKQ